MKTTEKLISCPYCGRPNECHTSTAGDRGPEKGDVTVCWRCRQMCLFETPTTLRKITDEERQRLLKDPAVRDVLYAVSVSDSPREAVSRAGKIS